VVDVVVVVVVVVVAEELADTADEENSLAYVTDPTTPSTVKPFAF